MMSCKAASLRAAASRDLNGAGPKPAVSRGRVGTLRGQWRVKVPRSTAPSGPRPRLSPARPLLIVSASTEASNQSPEASQEDSGTASRYSVSLSKPLGLILEENSNNVIYVAEIVAGGNAERSGLISAGDTLIATSGYVYTNSNEYTGNMVRSGEQLVTMNVKGETFDTVMAAIGSHPGHIQVQLEFERNA